MNSTQQRISAEDRRHQILAVARDLFAHKGFEGTTTREIAAGANVNEAIIFRHFATKEELYSAVMDWTCRTSTWTFSLKDLLDKGEDVRTTLTELATIVLERRMADTTKLRLLLFSALEQHELSHQLFKTYIAGYYETLSDYIRKKVEDGQFRETDPMLASRAFFSILIYHSLIQTLFGGDKLYKYDHKTVAESVVSLWLDGICTRER